MLRLTINPSGLVPGILHPAKEEGVDEGNSVWSYMLFDCSLEYNGYCCVGFIIRDLNDYVLGHYSVIKLFGMPVKCGVTSKCSSSSYVVYRTLLCSIFVQDYFAFLFSSWYLVELSTTIDQG